MIAKMISALAIALGTVISINQPVNSLPVVELRDAFQISLPGGEDGAGQILSIDSNSPAEWDNDGNLFVFTSSTSPYRSSGPSLFELSWPAQPVGIASRPDVRGGQWIEATHRAGDGTLYGWYHNEPPNLCGSSRVTAPRIGALVSYDDGQNWQDLGIILEAPPGSLNCGTRNFFFAGGNGDFSVILDRSGEYFYFFISVYHRQFEEQGVAVARMRFDDRDDPVGKVWKWRNGAWNDPGLGGHVTTTFSALIDWHRDNANAFWGPSVHFNSYLDTYVMLLNHAVDRNWSQEGIYISFNSNPENPMGWSPPQRLPIAQKVGWYPQVIGVDGRETDKVAGQVARLFISGRSSHEIIFYDTGNIEDEELGIPSRPSLRGRGAPISRRAIQDKSEGPYPAGDPRPENSETPDPLPRRRSP